MSSAMREPDPAASAPPPPGRPPRTFGQRFLGIFKRSNRHLLTEMIRYGFVSVLAFAVDYGVLIGLTELAHLDYLWSATISFILGAGDQLDLQPPVGLRRYQPQPAPRTGHVRADRGWSVWG